MLWLIVVISITTDEYIHWEQFASTVPEDGEAFTDLLGKSNQEMKSKVTSQFYKWSKH